MVVSRKGFCPEVGVEIVLTLIIGRDREKDRHKKDSENEHWKKLISAFNCIVRICKHWANYLTYILIFTLMKILGFTLTTIPISQMQSRIAKC